MTLTHILVDFENTQPAAEDVALLRDKDQCLWIFRGPGQKKYDAEFAEALLALGERVRIVKCEKSGRNALDMHIAFQIGRLLGEFTPATDAAPALSFVVVSRDTDYEPLLQYVRAQGYAARRVIDVATALGAAPTEKVVVAKAARIRSATSAPVVKTRPAAAKTRVATKRAPGAKAAKAVTKTASAKRAAKAPARSTETGSGPSIDELVEKVIDRLRDHPRSRPTRRDRMESWLASHLRRHLAGGDVSAIVAGLEKRGVLNFAGSKIEYPLW